MISGRAWRLVTATSADDACRERQFFGVLALSQHAAQSVDGVSLEAESYVGVDASGDADVGVVEEFFDHDEVDALFQEQGRGGVAELVEADASEPGPVEEAAEASGEIGRVEGPARRRGEDETTRFPCGSRCLALSVLLLLGPLEGVDAFGGQGDAAFGGAGCGVQDGEAARCGIPS